MNNEITSGEFEKHTDEFVNEALTEEEEAIDVPHITISRKHLKNFLSLASKLPNQTKDHCPFILVEVDQCEVDGTSQYVMYAYASDDGQISTLEMHIPVLNTKNVFMGSHLVLKKSTLSRAEKLCSGSNFTLCVTKKDSPNGTDVYDVGVFVYGGLLPVPQGAFTPESFMFSRGVSEGFVDTVPSEACNAMRYLSSVASTQTKDKLGSIQFLEDCAIVEDLGGHVRYAGRFLKHRVPKWSADVLQTLITSTSAKRLSVGIVRDKVSTYPCVAYESDDFVLTFSRFTLPMIVCPPPLMDSGISCQIGTLRNIARIPMEMKSEIHDYYDDSITLYLTKEGDTDVFRAKLGGKGDDRYIISPYEEFGEVRDYPSVKIPSHLLFQFLDSCKEEGLVQISFSDECVRFSLGSWSCEINSIVENG